MRSQWLSFLVPISLAVISLACGGPPAAAAETTPSRSTGADQRDGRSTARADGTAGAQQCALSSVYFEYDSNSLDGRARDALAQGATCLRQRPSESVTLVGGADARGTEEYNFALGDRRARTVQGYLVGAGVESERLRVRSVGEEWATGEDEASMARDRRVDPATPAR